MLSSKSLGKAMMAIVGLWVQNGLFGTPYGLFLGSVSKDVFNVESTDPKKACVTDPSPNLCDQHPQKTHDFQRLGLKVHWLQRLRE